MGSYALIQKGKVINTILWDGPDVSPMNFGKGVTYAEIPDDDGQNPSTGWSFDGRTFSPPPLTDDELLIIEKSAIAANVSLKQSLMDEASERISVLQDAIDLEMATAEEASALPLWKKYRVLLSRIDVNTSASVAWPEKPAA